MSTPVMYTLDIRLQGAPPERVTIDDKLTVGSSPQAEISIEGLNLDAIHCIFRYYNEILTVYNIGAKTVTYLDKQPLEGGRMYVLDKGDKLNIGKLEIIIRKSASRSGSSTPDTDETDPNIDVSMLEKSNIKGPGNKNKLEKVKKKKVKSSPENSEDSFEIDEQDAEIDSDKKGFGKVLGGLFTRKKK